jgi:hypothetical protein
MPPPGLSPPPPTTSSSLKVFPNPRLRQFPRFSRYIERSTDTPESRMSAIYRQPSAPAIPAPDNTRPFVARIFSPPPCPQPRPAPFARPPRPDIYLMTQPTSLDPPPRARSPNPSGPSYISRAFPRLLKPISPRLGEKSMNTANRELILFRSVK